MSVLLNTLLLYPDHPYDFDEIWARALDPATKEYYKFLVASPRELSRDCLYPKETALIENIREELRQGRRCQVYATYTGEKDVNARLEHVLSAAGLRVDLEVQPSSLASRTARPATASIPGRRIDMDAFRATSHDSVEEDPRAEQPSIRTTTEASEMAPPEPLGPPDANRHRLPDERPAITNHFAVGGHEGYLTVGLYPNGQPGEIFIRMAKEGSPIAGLMECFGTVVSVSLQHGVPLRVLCDKLSHTRFEPSGWTGNAELGYAKSIMDYLFRWFELRFLSGTQLTLFSAFGHCGSVGADPGKVVPISSQGSEAGDALACRSCGALMSANGNCYVCRNCGGTSRCS